MARVSVERRAQVMRRDGWRCRYCGKLVYAQAPRWSKRRCTLDHVIPRALFGTDSLENLVVACVACNMVKADRHAHEVGMVLLPPPEPHELVKQSPRWNPRLDLPASLDELRAEVMRGHRDLIDRVLAVLADDVSGRGAG